jgi:thioredoxin-disulfide reductase
MMAPIFKKLAQQVGTDKAVFCKVDTNTMYEISSKYQIRSLPTFVFFVGGHKWNQFSGAGEAQLQQMTNQAIRQAELENAVLERDALFEYYKLVDSSKTNEAVEAVFKKCVDMNKLSKACVGAPANQLARRLKQKYKTGPKIVPRFTEEDRKTKPQEEKGSAGSDKKTSANNIPNLHLATREELEKELEKRLDEELELQLEQEDDDDAEFQHSWESSGFPEKVVIIGGGPAGISAAIYAARAGLTPVVVCPPMGGQLQGKGVDVENYPGLHNMTGPGVIAAMRDQAASFGAVFEAEVVTRVNISTRPLVVHTNSSTITVHSIIVATGAESNWLGVPGEWDMRGGGVSSCATCDGAVYRGKDVVVVGGGDAAMEDALVLARTSKSVTVIHRRDAFRASKVLAQRVMEHPSIKIRWNSVVKEIVGETVGGDGDNVDLDDETNKIVKSVVLQNVETQEDTSLSCDAVFIAIGHTPATSFLKDIVEFEEHHPGYIKTFGGSTKTSVPGIFAAGDVADTTYRQAITSAGSGAAAALDAERWLSEEGLGTEAAELEAELMAEVMESETLDMAYNAYEDAGGRVKGMKESIGAEL